MKHLRILLTAAIGVVASTAFIGVASASATTVCTTLSSCSTTKYGTDVDANDKLAGVLASTNATLGTNLGNVVCTNSTVSGSSKSDGTGGSVTALAFNNGGTTPCTSTFSGTPTATVVVNNLSYTASLATVTGQNWNGTMTVNNPNVTVNLSNGLSCTYSATSVTGNVYNKGNSHAPVGGSSGSHTEVDFSGVSLTVSGGLLCPTTAHWTATYYVTPTDTVDGTDVFVG